MIPVLFILMVSVSSAEKTVSLKYDRIALENKWENHISRFLDKSKTDPSSPGGNGYRRVRKVHDFFWSHSTFTEIFFVSSIAFGLLGIFTVKTPFL